MFEMDLCWEGGQELIFPGFFLFLKVPVVQSQGVSFFYGYGRRDSFCFSRARNIPEGIPLLKPLFSCEILFSINNFVQWSSHQSSSLNLDGKETATHGYHLILEMMCTSSVGVNGWVFPSTQKRSFWAIGPWSGWYPSTARHSTTSVEGTPHGNTAQPTSQQ